MAKLIHYVYKTQNKKGEFYIGRHSSSKIDGYKGSGNWVKSQDPSSLDVEVLKICLTLDHLREQEEFYIKENFSNPLCKNEILSSYGWEKGKKRFTCWNKHKSWSSEIIEKNRASNKKRRLFFTEEEKKIISEKISKAIKGKKKTELHKKNIKENHWSKKGKSPWNKGLTKETDARVFKNAIAIKEAKRNETN